jgi:hypothetical protein
LPTRWLLGSPVLLGRAHRYPLQAHLLILCAVGQHGAEAHLRFFCTFETRSRRGSPLCGSRTPRGSLCPPAGGDLTHGGNLTRRSGYLISYPAISFAFPRTKDQFGAASLSGPRGRYGFLVDQVLLHVKPAPVELGTRTPGGDPVAEISLAIRPSCLCPRYRSFHCSGPVSGCAWAPFPQQHPER